MQVSSLTPAHLAKAFYSVLLFSILIVSLSAQEGYGTKPSGSMSGPPPTQATRPALEGQIVSIEGSTLVLQTGSGTQRVTIQADTSITGRQTASLASIKPGDGLGVAADQKPGGGLTATVITIFAPEMWQRARKGQFPMASGQVMTNAQVDRVVAKVGGTTLFLKYEMLTAAIDVPGSAEIRRIVILKPGDLKPGMKLTIRTTNSADGGLLAASISTDLGAGRQGE